MSGRRLAAVGAGVVALLVVAGVASHGRPLSAGGRGRGPTASFFDYVATSLIIVGVVVLAVVAYAMLTERPGKVVPRRTRSSLLSAVITIAGALLLSYILMHTTFQKRLQQAAKDAAAKKALIDRGRRGSAAKAARTPHIRWDEIAIVAVLLGGTAVVLFARRSTKRPPRPFAFGRRAEVSLALDESLDDLRADPDLRRAIIAAYARMEAALANAGLPRQPSEAPFEYVERALGTLDTSAGSVERLTSLFEWAKFSQHEPGPEMRDEAIAALVAVRDELRRPAETAVPA